MATGLEDNKINRKEVVSILKKIEYELGLAKQKVKNGTKLCLLVMQNFIKSKKITKIELIKEQIRPNNTFM